MIIASIRGGLGNQIFQYAYAKAFAARRSTGLWLNLSRYALKLGIRTFSLDAFDISCDRSFGSRVAERCLRRLPAHLVRTEQQPFPLVSDNGHGKFLYLIGFWESYRYLESIESELRKEFVLRHHSEAFRVLEREIRERPSMAVHVRRGDHVGHRTLALLDAEYYRNAAAALKAMRPDIARAFIFSDDPAWCREDLSQIADVDTVIIEGRGTTDAEELILMSRCAGNVISNSTFSWWSAYLNTEPEHAVVAPSRWFTTEPMNAIQLEKLVLPSWKLL